MTFLAPTALFGILLLAIPIVVHLFKPRKMKATPFSSLRWLRQAHQRLSRRIQWHQWLLFLLRAGVITFLVLALARPIIGLTREGSPADRILLLDTSQSMAYKSADLSSPWESARELASKLLEHPRPGQRTAVLLVDSKAKVLRPLVSDASGVVPLLQEIQPGGADTNLGSALPVIEGLLQGGDKARPAELIVFSDQQLPSWQQPDLQKFVKKVERPLSVKVIDVGLGSPSNAWVAGARLLNDASDQDRLLVVEVGCVGDQNQPRTVRLKGIAGVADEDQQLPLEPGKVSRVVFRLPGDLSLARQIAEIRLEPGDNLPGDDVWYLPLDATGKTRVLVIENDAGGQDGRPVGLFLRTGLQALQAGDKGAIDVQMRSPGSVTPEDIRKADLVALAGVSDLTDVVLGTLEKQVKAGMGLLVFVGPATSASFFNEKLHRALQPANGLVPLALAGDAFLHKPAVPSSLIHVRWQHPTLAPLNDPVLGDVLGNFSIYAKLKGEPGKNDQVLATFEDGTPALLEHPLGAGRVLLINSSANGDWTDLPRRQGFVPYLDRVVTYLARGGMSKLRTVGESVTVALEDWPADVAVQVVAPSGKKWAPRVQKRGEYLEVYLDELAEAGIYRLEPADGSERTVRVAVNAGRSDSRLTPLDGKVFTEWWAPVPVEIISGADAGPRFDASAWTWPLWPLLLVLVALLLMAETMYAAWLCPRRNQTLSESVVHERGLMRPLARKEA